MRRTTFIVADEADAMLNGEHEEQVRRTLAWFAIQMTLEAEDGEDLGLLPRLDKPAASKCGKYLGEWRRGPPPRLFEGTWVCL